MRGLPITPRTPPFFLLAEQNHWEDGGHVKVETEQSEVLPCVPLRPMYNRGAEKWGI